MKNIDIVIGANLGDEGKGRITSFVANKYDTDDTVVIRCSGGAQAGHTVKHGEIRHVFHHFGSGTLSGYKTFLSDTFIVNPILFRKEWEELQKKGFTPECYVDKNALVTNPIHMMTNQMWEESLEENRYGSCGCGIYETIVGDNFQGLKLTIKNILDEMKKDVGEFIYSMIGYFNNVYMHNRVCKTEGVYIPTHIENKYRQFLSSEYQLWKHWCEDLYFMIEHVVLVDDIKDISGVNNYAFEMSQGLLLSERFAKCDKVTPIDCTWMQAKNLIWDVVSNSPNKEYNIGVHYVSRWYVTRHGRGYLQHEINKKYLSGKITDDTNIPNDWQESLRFGLLNINDITNRIYDDFGQFCDWCEIHLDMCAFLNMYITCLDQVDEEGIIYMYNNKLKTDSVYDFLTMFNNTKLFRTSDFCSDLYYALNEDNDSIKMLM